jgi:hypothetical protein
VSLKEMNCYKYQPKPLKTLTAIANTKAVKINKKKTNKEK